MSPPQERRDGPQDQTKRSKSRRNVIGRSKAAEEYRRLLRNGWSSLALERYARFRHGEDIPASTFRAERKRLGLSATNSQMRGQADIDPDQLIDVLVERQELIALQKNRISIDTAHERTMNKLFASTRSEIQLLSNLINESKADLQDLGLFPKLGEIHTLHLNGQVNVPGEEPDDGRIRYTPAHRSLGEVIAEGVNPDQERQLARMLHDLMPLEIEQAQTNGHRNGHVVVDGEIVDGDVG